MSKPNGRGRGWNRKTWESLAPSTRKRYQSAGINAERYARGDTRHTFESWVKHQARVYGKDVDEIREELRGVDRGAVMDAIRQQQDAEKLFDSGKVSEARTVWLGRSDGLPDWMYYYHGSFS